MKIEEKLALDAFKTDKESHITINHAVCRTECKDRPCLFVCPARLYSYNEVTDEVAVEYAGCLECGTCRIACKALEWNYPKGDYGVQYRFG
jgi:ferredoxin like protein